MGLPRARGSRNGCVQRHIGRAALCQAAESRRHAGTAWSAAGQHSGSGYMPPTSIVLDQNGAPGSVHGGIVDVIL